MIFSEIEIAASQVSRNVGYVRDNVTRLWIPGGGGTQTAVSRELAGALLGEADVFFDRALVLYLLRTRLRDAQASSWADVACYYSNYFSATSFVRLHLHSVTHLVGGAIFDVKPAVGAALTFSLSERKRRLGHSDVWREYYRLVTQMGWPDSTTVSLLAPSVGPLQCREQRYRERVNYMPGEGFTEIHLSKPRYLSEVMANFKSIGAVASSGSLVSDAAYNDHLAVERLRHVGTLLSRMRDRRRDIAIEEDVWIKRRKLVERYSFTLADKREALQIIHS